MNIYSEVAPERQSRSVGLNMKTDVEKCRLCGHSGKVL